MSRTVESLVNKKIDWQGRTALHQAAGNNNLSEVKKWLSVGAEVNARDTYNTTPLHLVAFENVDESHFEVAEVLLNNGADLNARDALDRTPLYLLVQNGSARIIRLFMNFNADFTVTNDSRRNLLFSAASNNKNEEVIQLLIDQGTDVNHRSDKGTTPLHEVAEKNVDESLFDVAEILLKNKADVNARDTSQQTPLFHLVRKGNLRIFQLFLNFDADVEVENDLGESLLFPAARNNENVQVLQQLIDLGLDVNRFSSCTQKRTPLHYSVLAVGSEMNRIKTIKCLLKNDANANAIDAKGYTPFMEAVSATTSWCKLPEAVIKKNLNFIMEHADFNAAQGDVNILTIPLFPDQYYLWKNILEHIAKLQMMNVPVHQAVLDAIPKRKEFNDYYEKCQEELLRAKSTKLQGSWLTFYNLLVDSRKKVKNYSGNQDLIEDFKKINCAEKFPIYGVKISENVNKGIKRRELVDKSTVLLSDCLPIFSPTHLIVRDLVDCMLSKKDLSKFCE